MRESGRERDRERERQIDRKRDRQRKRETDRQKFRQIDKGIDRGQHHIPGHKSDVTEPFCDHARMNFVKEEEEKNKFPKNLLPVN